jgi:hypothetical protein
MLLDKKYVCPWCKTDGGGERVHTIGVKSSEKCVRQFAYAQGVGYVLHDEYYEIVGRRSAYISVDAKDGAMELLDKWPEMQEKVESIELNHRNCESEFRIQSNYHECVAEKIMAEDKKHNSKVAILRRNAKQYRKEIDAERRPDGKLWREPGDKVSVGDLEASKLHRKVRSSVSAWTGIDIARWEDSYVVEGLIDHYGSYYIASTDRVIELTKYEYAIERELFASKVGIDLDAIDEEED